MEFSVEQPGGLERRLKVTVPVDKVDGAVKDRVRKVGAKAKVPGFRPGKAPMNVLLQRYGDQARQEVLGDLIQESYGNALDQSELRPAGQPNIEVTQVPLDGQPLEYTAVFDVYPEVELKGLDKLKVERPVVEITDADVERVVESMREQNKHFHPVDRAAKEGDQVKIDFLGKLDGEPFEGGKGEDFENVIGSGQLLPDMENGLVGHAAGEDTFTIDVAFPEDYHSELLKGKTAQFDITLKEVAEPHMPEVDEDFIKKAGVEEGTVEALHAKLRESMQTEADKAAKNQVKAEIMDGLLKANELDVPRGLVAQELDNMRREASQRLPENMRGDAEKLKELMPDEIFSEGAQRRVSLGLLLAEVIKHFDIKLDEAKVDEVLKSMAQGYGQSEEVINYYKSNPQIMQGIEAMAMEEQVVEKLVEGAKVKEVTMSYEKLMEQAAQQSQRAA
ncbi:MAG: trigger factor [Salinisphaeraceae bacterium]|nr:trigger factor [Salinisphaeraceae bacterium]